MRRYQRQLQQDERSFKKIPHHDWTSHYSDAFRMLAVATQNVVKTRKEKPKEIEGIRELPYGGFCLGVSLEDMYKQVPRQTVARV